MTLTIALSETVPKYGDLCEHGDWRHGVASPVTSCRYAHTFVFIDCENE